MMANTRESEAIKATGHGELSQLPHLTSAFEALKEAYDAEDAFFRLKTWSLSQSALCASADQIEHELFRGGMEIQRRLLEENIRARGRGEVGQAIVVSSHNLQADGQEEDGVSEEKRLWRKQEHRCQYESLFGTVPVERIGYSIPGEASVHPLDEALNLPH
jgi:hypothetical protein